MESVSEVEKEENEEVEMASSRVMTNEGLQYLYIRYPVNAIQMLACKCNGSWWKAIPNKHENYQVDWVESTYEETRPVMLTNAAKALQSEEDLKESEMKLLVEELKKEIEDNHAKKLESLEAQVAQLKIQLVQEKCSKEGASSKTKRVQRKRSKDQADKGQTTQLL